ncbi:MAG: 3-hydroxybutyryl-CoA dehydrogenase [Chitinophagales bacterium]|nr:3-hydroxybutyryl-CoA dehydrogenase [Chitinophagales bacterium]
MKNITVVGAGTMGNGIAHVCAQNGFKVTLVDLQEQLLQNAIVNITKNLERQVSKNILTETDKINTLNNIQTSIDLKAVATNSDLVIEVASENISVKENIFKLIDSVAPEHTIIASNTSSISITKLASFTNRPDRVIGMHFMNPVPVMKLVEVIRGYSTSDKTTNTIMDMSKRLNKTPVEVNDYPGFVANRILMPMINEAIYTLFEGVGKVEEIDTVMKLGMAHPMGPLQLADFIGLDVCLAIMNVLYDGFKNPKYAPCTLLVNMVTSGKLGVKSGEGFYVYTKGSKDIIVAPSFQK